MNAPAPHRNFFTGEKPGDDNVVSHKLELLHVQFQFGDSLMLNLYGDAPTAEHGHQVVAVTAIDSLQDISVIFDEFQLEKMGEWLDFHERKDGTGRQIAEHALRAVRRGKLN